MPSTRSQRATSGKLRSLSSRTTNGRKTSDSQCKKPVRSSTRSHQDLKHNDSTDTDQDDSSDEDDVPLNQRRFFKQNAKLMPIASPGSLDDAMEPDNTSEPVVQPVHNEQNKRKVDTDDHAFPSEAQSRKRPRTSETLQEQGDVILSKLGLFFEQMDATLDDTPDLTDRDPSSATFWLTEECRRIVNLRVSAMQKFTHLMLKAAACHVVHRVDAEKMAKVFKVMDQDCVRALEMDVLAEYSKHRESNIDIKGLFSILVKSLDVCVMMFEIAASCKLEKHCFPEEIPTTALQRTRNLLENLIYPIIDINGIEDNSSALRKDTYQIVVSVKAIPQAGRLLSSILSHITQLLRHTTTLLHSGELSEHTIIVIGFITISPFFHDYLDEDIMGLLSSPDGDKVINPFEQMKFGALDTLQTLFSHYPQHRQWVLSEILMSLSSLTAMDRNARRYRLRDNTKIHVVSALFMRLVQSSTVLGNMEEHRHWTRQWEIQYQHRLKEGDTQDIEKKLVQRAAECFKLADAAVIQSAAYFLEFLLSKCKSRKRDAYSLAEFRSIMESMMQDILVVLNDPEWPAAEAILCVFVTILKNQLNSEKSDLYLNSFAIEWLGIIACRIKEGYQRIQDNNTGRVPEWIPSLHTKMPMEITDTTMDDTIRLLSSCENKIQSSLGHGPMSQFYAHHWGHFYTTRWMAAQEASKDPDTPDWLPDSVSALQGAVRESWMAWLGMPTQRDKADAQFDFPELHGNSCMLLMEVMATRHTLYKSFDAILSEIMACLQKETASYRTKALRAIKKIAQTFPEILKKPHIHTPILQRIHDSSPSVRDAAVDVITKYLDLEKHVPRKLYDIISQRIMDTAVNVRKRVTKLLHELYFKCNDNDIKMDIASKITGRITDNEVSISDLALKLTQEILFHPFHDLEKEDQDGYVCSLKERRRRVAELTNIIVGSVSRHNTLLASQNIALAEIVKKTVASCDDSTRVWLQRTFQWIVDALFERMLAHDESGETEQFTYCLATAHAFIQTCPHLLRETHIAMLQPYLTVGELDNWQTACHVLSIYKDVLPRMKQHDASFIQMLETMLIRLISRCPLEAVGAIVSCLCVMVDRISHRYHLLVRIFGSCIDKLLQDRKNIEAGLNTKQSTNNIRKLLLICGCLCQHFDFEEKRKAEAEQMKALDSISMTDIPTFVYKTFLFYVKTDSLPDADGIQISALQGLGCLFKAHPTLIISSDSTDLMDNLFDQQDLPMQVTLMKVFREFLMEEEIRLDKREQANGASLYTKQVDVATLMGDTEEFAELGVNGSLMQRYLSKILKCAVNDHVALRHCSFEVTEIVIHQGLVHPLLCMPTIMATQTSADLALRDKAYYLHKFAHDKYGMLIYAQFGECFHTAFTYKKMLFGRHTRGFDTRPNDTEVVALFSPAFNILREKRKAKIDFITSLVKPFKIDLKESEVTEQVDIDYLRFMADNMATLLFTQSEDVLLLAHTIHRILATVGADLLAYIQFLKKHKESGRGNADYAATCTLAKAMYLLVRVKTILQDVYNLSESEITEYDPEERHQARTIIRERCPSEEAQALLSDIAFDEDALWDMDWDTLLGWSDK